MASLAQRSKSSQDDFFAEHGYMPALHPGEKETVAAVHPRERRQAVSVTLAQSYDDWCLAQLARSLGNEADYQFFLKRAGDYKNVFRRGQGSCVAERCRWELDRTV